MCLLRIALHTSKAIGTLVTVSVIRVTSGEKSLDTGHGIGSPRNSGHHVTKSFAPLPEKTTGVDILSGFETKLMGEASGTL